MNVDKLGSLSILNLGQVKAFSHLQGLNLS
jgi:hypothetical protein